MHGRQCCKGFRENWLPSIHCKQRRNGKNTLYIQSTFWSEKRNREAITCMSFVSLFWNKSKGRCYCYITYLPSVRHNSNLLVCHQSIENYIQRRMTAGNAGVIRVEEQMSTDMDGETVSGAGPASSTRRRRTTRTTGSNRRMACHGSTETPYS